MKKVFVVGGNYNYASFLDKYKLVDSIKEADIVMFTGGEDVDPSLYNENKHPTTFSNLDRDLYEKAKFHEAVDLKKDIIGICRGSQFLTVMNGGRLIQHANNHGIAGRHNIKFDDKEEHPITSTHHQMMYPYNLDKKDYRLIAVSSPNRSDVYLDGNDNDIRKFVSDKYNSICVICEKTVKFGQENKHNCFKEPEIVYYYKTKSLAIQGHPEMMSKKDSVVIKLNEIIKDGNY